MILENRPDLLPAAFQACPRSLTTTGAFLMWRVIMTEAVHAFCMKATMKNITTESSLQQKLLIPIIQEDFTGRKHGGGTKTGQELKLII